MLYNQASPNSGFRLYAGAHPKWRYREKVLASRGGMARAAARQGRDSKLENLIGMTPLEI
jgi:hypothetical protein